MLGRIFTWGLLAAGAGIAAYLDVTLAGQPEQAWLPVVTLAAFAAMSGCLIEI